MTTEGAASPLGSQDGEGLVWALLTLVTELVAMTRGPAKLLQICPLGPPKRTCFIYLCDSKWPYTSGRGTAVLGLEQVSPSSLPSPPSQGRSRKVRL